MQSENNHIRSSKDISNPTEFGPLFIVGLPRSGTTLLSTLLSVSEHLCITTEIWYFNYWVKKYSFLDFDKKEDVKLFLDLFLDSLRFKYLGLEKAKILSAINQKGKITHESIFLTLLDEYAKKMQKQYAGEKTPGQYKVIPEILQRFGHAKIICVIRDPRSVAASLLKTPWGSNFVTITAKRWAWYIRQVNKVKHLENVHCVRYEDLISAPAQIVNEIMNFLGLPPINPEYIERDRSEFFTTFDSGWSKSHFKAATAPINANSLEKWKKELSTIQLRAISNKTSQLAEPFGYALEHTDGLSTKIFQSKENILFKMRSFFKKLLAPIWERSWYNKLAYKFGQRLYEKNSVQNNSGQTK